ncbi:hypothetical protein QJS04_geneDACA005067 [Acorus gramineus]|uniref:SEC63 domain-containing protein n=1 Tax=Acorus gramineus TaxID=55184 RepID=A0AAV9AY04_ACOGR|nr:hypothetical protein QJS04_geneDACA005067 [Acorus gramineus]
MEHSKGKSALVFCSTRKGAQEAAQRIAQTAMTFGYSNPFIRSKEQQERLKDASLSCSDKQMQSCILFGVGYHNGGLSLNDRSLVEATDCASQMCGRAGRPPFDDTGTVIVMTRKETNPQNYGVNKNIPRERLENHMREPGRLMTKYYLKFDTMKEIVRAPENCSLEDVLHILCRSEETAWIQLRRNEKKLLNDINSDKNGRLRFHVLGENGKRRKRIQSREDKIFVLVNDCLTGEPSIHDLSLNQALHSMAISSFEALAEADPRKIEIITGRKYPFGDHIKGSLHSLPSKVEMKIEEAECVRRGRAKLIITLSRISQPIPSTKHHYADMVVGSEEDNLILFHEKIRVEEFPSPYAATVLVSIPQYGKVTVKAHLIFEEYGGGSLLTLGLLFVLPHLMYLMNLVYPNLFGDGVYAVGLDVQEKLLLTWKAANSNINRAHISHSVLPREVCTISDDDDSQLPIEELHVPRKSKSEISSIPSFNLFGDEMDEGVITPEPEEPPGRETLTEKTVFDHIREKAKSFPSLTISDAIKPPLQSPGENIKRARDDQTKLQCTKRAKEPETQRDAVILLDSEPSYNAHEDFRYNANINEFRVSTDNGGQVVHSIGYSSTDSDTVKGTASQGVALKQRNVRDPYAVFETLVERQQQQCSSLKTLDVSFLGCRSVFWFL